MAATPHRMHRNAVILRVSVSTLDTRVKDIEGTRIYVNGCGKVYRDRFRWPGRVRTAAAAVGRVTAYKDRHTLPWGHGGRIVPIQRMEAIRAGLEAAAWGIGPAAADLEAHWEQEVAEDMRQWDKSAERAMLFGGHPRSAARREWYETAAEAAAAFKASFWFEPLAPFTAFPPEMRSQAHENAYHAHLAERFAAARTVALERAAKAMGSLADSLATPSAGSKARSLRTARTAIERMADALVPGDRSFSRHANWMHTCIDYIDTLSSRAEFVTPKYRPQAKEARVAARMAREPERWAK